jgi:uncharacterized protein YhdP
MRPLLFSLSRFIVVFLASSIVFFALVVLVGRIITPYFSHRTQLIENFASNLLHKPVQISQFAIVWQGWIPNLQGRNVIIWNDAAHTKPLIQIQQLEVGIDLVKTLLTGNIKFGEIKGTGMDLEVHQLSNNEFTFNGMNAINPAQNSVADAKEILAWLLSTETQLSLQKVNLNYFPLTGPKWPTAELDAILRNQFARHQLSMQLKFLEASASSLTLIADVTAAALQKSFIDMQGQIYLEGHKLLLDRWFQAFTKNYAMDNGNVDFKIWATWQRDHFTQSRLVFSNLKNAVLTIAKLGPITFAPFSANINWQVALDGNWEVDTLLHNFNISPWERFPGITGLNAYFHGNPISGSLLANSKNLELDFQKLFKTPLHFSNFSTELNWQRKENSIFIEIPHLLASNADAAINAQLSFSFPPDKKGSDMSLLAHIKAENPERIAYYLPRSIMGPVLEQWLNKAIVAGIGEGTAVVRGPIVKFPFDENEGVFSINAKVNNAELHYEAGWPNVKKINGEIIFLGRQMQILVTSAEIFGTPVKMIKAYIPLMKAHVQTVLYIAADTIKTRLEKGFAFLSATPLKQKIGSQLSGLILTGPLQLALQLTIPLESGKETLKVNGVGNIENAKARIPLHNIQIDNLNGQFSVTQTGLQAKNLTGLLWNKPIKIDIRSVPNTQLTINYAGIQTELSPQENGIRFAVNNNTARGTVFIPNNKEQAIEANFSSIYLSSASTEQNNWDLKDLKQIPKVNLNVDDISYGNIDFGELQLKIRPLLEGVAIRDLQAGNASYHLIANGVWHRRPYSLTNLIGQLDSPNLSGFLRSWGLPASITAEQAHIRFNLQWSGAPYDIGLDKLRGNVAFQASDGQIVDIGSSAEAKIGFGRLLTFLSLQSLGRRLQLDFRDLQAKGFDFTSLQGNFNLRNGNAYTHDVSIEGPVASITIVGRIGLAAKDYDLTITVVPHFTSSLPVIVGLAGGPIAGAVTWVANTILGSTVQKIAATSYHITGSWGKPEVVKTSS